jgi:3-hydroxymyristoyl/3-hydroxydecanoyl-(acyl carrier protein) dehydratase/1-acyl-sn-glycerol-3-phosphate acyltransferase
VEAERSTPLPTGLTLDRAGLQIHASGRISEIFGPRFVEQDGFRRQCRMPEPPLLLADRMTGLRAEPASQGTGTVWTETDVRDDSWWLHQGRMPAGIHIESGQADLLLISYLGADLLNQDKRAYRLLGCALTWHGDLPKPGETLCYDIHVDGHARQGDVRLFFFHYDCRINGELRLSVRHGQAGFFTDEELAGSAGVIWSPEDESLPPGKPLDPPAIKGTKTAFSAEDVIAFSEGRPWECFGPGFEWTKTHVRTPRIQSGQMRFLGAVPVLDPTGGPWGRGYLRAETTLSDDDWYYKGHFKNDPCMPGTLMFEGTVQALSFLMAGMGFTVKRDGWRFQPVKDETFLMRCRGQVIPGSKKLVYEVFVREVVAGPIPTVRADLLCTVDGLKAFHARAVGLELVPDWPITSHPELLATHVDKGPVAVMQGFQYGYASLLACAWGRPSDAFGPRYAIFDGARTVPRLPGPPYHFMSRIRSVSEPIGAMKAGVTVVADYDIPADAWYFAENGQPAMPLAVLMEAALQPCGWLASWAGAALESPIDLGFRNLDGTGTMHRPVLPGDGTLTTTATLTRLSRTAGMVIVAFEVRSALQTGELIYTMDTVFGFFPAEALASQAGLPTTPAQRAWLTDPSDTRIDLRTKPAPFFRPGGLATGRLLMLDRITGHWPEGGEAGKGRLRAEKDVDAGEWFFKAHFYTDPVQPGSLGVEAMLQAVQAWMLLHGRDEGVENPVFEPIAVGRAISWKYRGQVQAMDRLISTTIDVLEEGVDAEGCPYTLAAASLWIDGKRIYEARPVGMRVRPGPPPLGPKTVRLDPAVDRWVADHCPTWTVPALPMMDIVDRLAAAAGPAATGLADLRLQGWVVVDRPRTLETRLEGDRVLLLVDGAEAARARVLTDATPAPSPWPALEGEPEPDPYAAGALFHGPAFAVLRSLVLRPDGSTAHLDAAPTAAPLGRLHPALLDGATHGIPHEELGRWFPGLDRDRVAYPAGLRELRWWGPPPTSGVVRVEARPVGKLGAHAVALSVQLIVDEPHPRVWASFTLIEASFPKGPIGQAPRPLRRAFLQGFAVPGLGLAAHGPDGTTLRQADVEGSDWLPGTVEALYGTRDLTTIAVKEHLAVWTGLHPRVLPEALPLNRFPLSVTEAEGQVTVAPAGPPSLDLTPVERYWSDWFGLPGWPVEDIFYSLIHRFVRRVVTVDPAGLRRLHGRSVLFLANHQVGVESLLFSVLASGLIGNPTLTLAKAEHQHTWLGDLIRHSFRWPGAKDPQVIAYFDREDKGSLLRIAGELALGMAAGERSVMVHIEGTRSLSCETPVQKMSGIFIDMALQTGVPIVPVRFVGGLPREPMEHRIEYPTGLGSQDIYLGAPIEPEALRDLLPGARKTKVIAAINALGPPNALELPNPGDPVQEAEAQAWATTTGARIEHAVLWSVLERMPTVGAQMERLREAVRRGEALSGDDAETAWLQVLLGWFRPRG